MSRSDPSFWNLRSVEILSCQVAGALFYDLGDAFNGYDHLHPYDAVGVGLRALFPQLDRTVFRVDVGFPLARPLPTDTTGIPISPVAFTFAFTQAFGVPNAGALPGTVPQATDGSPQTHSDTVVAPGTSPTPLGVLGR